MFFMCRTITIIAVIFLHTFILFIQTNKESRNLYYDDFNIYIGISVRF